MIVYIFGLAYIIMTIVLLVLVSRYHNEKSAYRLGDIIKGYISMWARSGFFPTNMQNGGTSKCSNNLCFYREKKIKIVYVLYFCVGVFCVYRGSTLPRGGPALPEAIFQVF